ncbi:uncharacterized protein L201_000880 [Kwoniella dendrophila CBS 6074]|uniref:Uncharacterized protein n=1 Tax=Kwoniella dendrophila CBS 6074 TaxID=1295534 RepID=A0AAX4JKT4_9TREE
MSTSEIPIDPSLQDAPPQPIHQPPGQSTVRSPKKVAGTKRKTRAGGNNAVASSSTSARVTRRSTGSAVAATQGQHVTEMTNEPSRGEEENLNGYWGPANTKRARRSSPTKRSKPSAASVRYNPSNPSMTDPSHPSSGSGHNTIFPDFEGESGLSLAGIEELAAAATTANAKSSGILPYIPMYPVGLTSFRYPCLKPSEPNPPPGDPNDPNFRPFNPHEPIHVSPPTSTNSQQNALPTQPTSNEGSNANTKSNTVNNQPIDPELINLSLPSTLDPSHNIQNQHNQPQFETQDQYQDQNRDQNQLYDQNFTDHQNQLYSGNQEQAIHDNSMMDQNTAASANAAYESISALLSASQGVYPTLESLDYSTQEG